MLNNDHLDFLQLIHSPTKWQLVGHFQSSLQSSLMEKQTKKATCWLLNSILASLWTAWKRGAIPSQSLCCVVSPVSYRSPGCNRRIFLRNDADLMEHLKHLAWKSFPQHFKHCRVGDGGEGVRRMALGCSLLGCLRGAYTESRDVWGPCWIPLDNVHHCVSQCAFAHAT